MPIWTLHPKNRESPVGQGPEECVVLLQARYHCLRRANSKTFNKWESVEDSNGSSNQKYYDGLLVGDLQRVDIQGQLASLWPFVSKPWETSNWQKLITAEFAKK